MNLVEFIDGDCVLKWRVLNRIGREGVKIIKLFEINTLKGLYKKNPLIRFVIDNYYIFTEKAFGYRREKKAFFKKKGYKLDLKNPRSLSEKIVWKKINDRNPLLPITADKYRVRLYIEQTLGIERARDILIPLLYVTDNPNTIPFNKLPKGYIIKANHGSGWNIIVDDNYKTNMTEDEIVTQCWEWLKSPYAALKHEWAYKQIKRMIVIEKLLKDDEGKPPKDFRFYMVHGKCRLIRISFDRFGTPSHSTFTSDWEFLPIDKKPRQGPNIDKPKTYDQMVLIAEELAQNFDFIRVDFYNIDGRIYIGELTHYPRSGKMEIPQNLDIELGEYWEITPKYWLKKQKTLY